MRFPFSQPDISDNDPTEEEERQSVLRYITKKKNSDQLRYRRAKSQTENSASAVYESHVLNDGNTSVEKEELISSMVLPNWGRETGLNSLKHAPFVQHKGNGYKRTAKQDPYEW